MISRNIIARIFSLFVLFFLMQKSFAQSLNFAKAEVITVSGETVVSNVTKVPGANQEVYTTQLNNTSKHDQNITSVNVMVTPPALIPNNTTYMIGADEMLRREGNMLQQQTGKPIRNKDNNMYLMFKISESDYMLIGVISWRTFLCKMYEENGIVHIEGDGDKKLIKAGEKINFEKIVCLHDASWQNLLDRYADLIVKENNVKPPPNVTWKGWATWDFYVQYFLKTDVERNTDIIKKLPAGTNIIQIDGGWWKQRGDYFDVRDNLPGGIKSIAAEIHKQGFKAGLHFDGYRVSKAANIVKDHPEYFIHTDDGKILELGKDVVTKDPIVYWDYSHPGAQKYITDVMENARKNWGIDYFKIDFMRNGLAVKGKSYLPVTNLERYRMGIVAMKKGIQNAYFLACSPNFGANIGLIEASRTGPDIDPNYEQVKIRAQHNSGSYYFNRKIYNCDPDYLVLRSAKESNERDGKKPSFTFEQATMWANYVSIFGNVRLESDELSLLPQTKLDLATRTFQMPFFVKAIPMDMWDHFKTDNDAPNFFLCKSADGIICIGIFNWGDGAANFSISGFKKTAQLKDFTGDKNAGINNGSFSVPLQGVQSVLFKYNGSETFDELRKELMITVK